MTGRIRVRASVTGRVQGVGYRWSTTREAQRLGLSGSVRNLDDGTVEVIAEGDPADVRALLEWLRRGPAGARVEGVATTDEEPTGGTGFHAE